LSAALLEWLLGTAMSTACVAGLLAKSLSLCSSQMYSRSLKYASAIVCYQCFCVYRSYPDVDWGHSMWQLPECLCSYDLTRRSVLPSISASLTACLAAATHRRLPTLPLPAGTNLRLQPPRCVKALRGCSTADLAQRSANCAGRTHGSAVWQRR
jgi:hypothetical protein